jgi:hypothetical protein
MKKLFTNTPSLAALFVLAIAFMAISSTRPCQPPMDEAGPGDQWTVLQDHEGVVVFYNIRECTPGTNMLCMKVVNKTGAQRKLKFTAEVTFPGATGTETFNFQKTIAPFTTEKADCSEETRMNGLSRPLKQQDGEPLVSIFFNKTGELVGH